MYTYEYINPLRQFDYINYDLILTDNEEILPTIRLLVSIPVNELNIEERLVQIAEQQIELALNAPEVFNPPEEEY